MSNLALPRRKFLFAGLVTPLVTLATPTIVKASSLMPLRGDIMDPYVIAYKTVAYKTDWGSRSSNEFIASRFFAGMPKRLWNRIELFSRHERALAGDAAIYHEYTMVRRSQLTQRNTQKVKSFDPQYVEMIMDRTNALPVYEPSSSYDSRLKFQKYADRHNISMDQRVAKYLSPDPLPEHIVHWEDAPPKKESA